MGIEPTSSAWKAEVLPLNHTRSIHGVSHEYVQVKCSMPSHPRPRELPCVLARLFSSNTQESQNLPRTCTSVVEGGGFEPPKAEPSDLQSDPFDHSGTPPQTKLAIVIYAFIGCQGQTRAQGALLIMSANPSA